MRGKPLADGLGDDLYEIRTQVGKRAYRVLFRIAGSTIVVLHGFQKKNAEDPEGSTRLGPQPSARSGGATMNKHVGSTLASLVEELGEKDEIDLLTQKKLLALKSEPWSVGR